jgi:hypothetical protein
MELLMAAQFDTGFYRQIRFIGSDGKVGFRASRPRAAHAPGWFVAMLPIASTPAWRRCPTAGARSARCRW